MPGQLDQHDRDYPSMPAGQVVRPHTCALGEEIGRSSIAREKSDECSALVTVKRPGAAGMGCGTMSGNDLNCILRAHAEGKRLGNHYFNNAAGLSRYTAGVRGIGDTG